jgi:3-hydroxyacyl-[acyl-carrier-protein] dehydratase
MNKEEIKSILPHREPMLLLDKVELDGEGRAHGFYTVRGDEWFLQGHFPDNPIVPGVIQCEMLAQSCCAMLAEQVKGKLTLFTGMDKVRFKRQVVPGDTMEFICAAAGGKGPFQFAEGTGYVNSEVCVKASMSCALLDK